MENRMRVVVGLPLCFFILLALGCVNAIRVHQAGDKSQPGVPFFVKKAAFEQRTTYQQSWLEVSLSRTERAFSPTAGSKPVEIEAKFPPRRVDATAHKELNELRLLISNFQQGEIAFAKLLEHFNNLPEPPSMVSAVLVGNQVSEKAVVDHETTHYLNAPLPWFGEANVTTKLSADGTLTEASTETSTGLADAISSLLPLKEFLTAELITESSSDDAVAEAAEMDFEIRDFINVLPPAQPVRLVEVATVQIEEKGFVFEFTVMHEKDPRTNGTDGDSCPGQSKCVLQPIPFDVVNGLYSRKPLGAKAGTKKPENAIGISGQITLPKPSAGS